MAMENFSSLLFELSSGDRLDILMLLKKTPLKLSHVSSKLDFTVQETSRNVTRLSDAKLIAKDVEGAFHLTPFGEDTLNLLSGFKFLYKNREYLLTHSLSEFPQQFRAGVGILNGFEFVADVMTVFHNIENMIANAEQFVWILSNQVLASTIPYLLRELERGGEFRLLMQKDYTPTNDVRELVTNPIFFKATRNNKLDARFLDKVGIFLCLSEKEVGALAFPTLEGKLDYTGFRAKDETAIEWAKTLYTYYWTEASTQVPDQLFNPQRQEQPNIGLRP
jgi:predicted transcriptional regulator